MGEAKRGELLQLAAGPAAVRHAVTLLGAGGAPLQPTAAPAPAALPSVEMVTLQRVMRSQLDPTLTGFRLVLAVRTSLEGGKVFSVDIPVGSHARNAAGVLAELVAGLEAAAAEQEAQANGHTDEKGTGPSEPGPAAGASPEGAGDRSGDNPAP